MSSLIHSDLSVDPLNNEALSTFHGMDPRKRDGHAEGAQAASLGNTTKLCDTNKNNASEVRSTNYQLRRVAQEILGVNHRVFTCQKVPSYTVQQGLGERGISKNEDGRAFFHGLGSCGDVHCCPVCSVKISEGRRQEVIHALRSHRESGYIALLATFTFPHSRDDSLCDNLTAFRSARSDLIRSRKYRDIMKVIRMTGYIRRLEVTWGNSNGWHPHDHEIWFLDREKSHRSGIAHFKYEIFKLWSYYCLKHGLAAPTEERGFDLRFNNQGGDSAVGSYLTKWGHELTYGHTKQANGEDRHTPFSFLHSLQGNYSPKFASLFQEYARAFKGRAQLLWSRGLKDKFGINEITDGELSELPEKEHYLDINVEQSFRISYLNRFSTVLDYAERYSSELTIKYINSLFDESNKRLSKNFKRRRSSYVSDIRLVNMLDSGFYEQGAAKPEQVTRE
jgi:hypothetical protein